MSHGNTTPDGGWAFPCSVYDGLQPGMSLRDRIAIAAMQGLLSNANGRTALARTSESAYAMADAMLKARQS